MTMKIKWRWIIAAAFTFPNTSSALWMEVTPIYVLNTAAPTHRQAGASLGWTGNVTSSIGLLTSINLFQTPFDFETGLISLNQSSQRDITGGVVVEKSNVLHMPLVIRLNIDQNFGFGVGGYISWGRGSVYHEELGGSYINSYSEAGFRTHDIGLIFSARASLAISPGILYFILDGRYQHGLNNIAKTGGDLRNTRSMQGFFGLSFPFQI